MKKMIPVFCAALLLTAFSCDKVKNPIVPKETVVGSDFVTNNNFSVSETKKMLLEDYTGMKCTNCPRAAETAEDMVNNVYQEDLIVVAVHSGGFAIPDLIYKPDFRTNTGDVWKEHFGVTSYPSGIVNRKNYASNGVVVGDSKWTTLVSLANSDPFILKLNLTTNYDTTVGALNVDIKATFKKAYSNGVKISVI